MRYSLLPERNKALAKPNTSMLGSIEYAESIDVGGYFDGNVRVIHEGPIGTLIDLPYTCFAVIKKTVATQSGDYAMILRVKSSLDGDRITITERSSGKINCRVRNGSGTVAREIESDFIPALGDTYRVFIIWDGSTTLTQLIYCDGVAYVKTSTTQVSIPADSDPNGFISMGQTYDGLYSLTARSILGGFAYSVYTTESITELCEANRVPVGSFLYNPAVMGNYNTNVIREPSGRNMTIITTGSVDEFWNNTSNMKLLSDGDYKQVLLFSGPDYINLGEPEWITSLMYGATSQYKIECEFIPFAVSSVHIFAIALSHESRFTSAYLASNTSIAFHVNGLTGTGFFPVKPMGHRVNKHLYEVDRQAQTKAITTDGVRTEVSIEGVYNPNWWTPPLVGSRTVLNPTAFFSGIYKSIAFYTHDNVLVEKFLFEEGEGDVLTGVNGNTALLVDGNVNNIWSIKQGSNQALLGDGYVTKTGNTYNLNPVSLPALTEQGIPNTYLTRTQIAALHNGINIFTSPVDYVEDPRVKVYSNGYYLSDKQIQTNNLYVGRI